MLSSLFGALFVFPFLLRVLRPPLVAAEHKAQVRSFAGEAAG
ncbi:MAG: hypothetical protein Q8R02_10195 [Hyphomonadaceae bacterium]|nr:hypothetical protein [Hyphomonadaceae bacterium]